MVPSKLLKYHRCTPKAPFTVASVSAIWGYKMFHVHCASLFQTVIQDREMILVEFANLQRKCQQLKSQSILTLCRVTNSQETLARPGLVEAPKAIGLRANVSVCGPCVPLAK